MLYYNIKDENDYASIPDMGCLKAIYYGPDISSNDKAELHEIASTKGIKEYDVSLDLYSRKYDLKITPFIWDYKYWDGEMNQLSFFTNLDTGNSCGL